jgi:hypothetical protein
MLFYLLGFIGIPLPYPIRAERWELCGTAGSSREADSNGDQSYSTTIKLRRRVFRMIAEQPLPCKVASLPLMKVGDWRYQKPSAINPPRVKKQAISFLLGYV